MKKVERLEKKIKANAQKYIDALYEQEKRWATQAGQEFVEAEERDRLNRDYYFSTRIEDEGKFTILAVEFDGGRMWDEINLHWFLKSGGDSENWEDWYEDTYFEEEKAEKIFGLKNLDWQPYASWRLEIFV
jgi:hypothetical protein|tara:strand:- start:597 stop:989 length:393 start_codon:yes stop_codon:yes gene_type:complete